MPLLHDLKDVLLRMLTVAMAVADGYCHFFMYHHTIVALLTKIGG